MKKLTSFLLTLLLVVAAFGACAESDKPYAGETITYWMQKYGTSPDTQIKALDQLTADFYEKTGIKVEYSLVDWGQAHTKYTLAMTGGECPDVADTFFAYSWVAIGGEERGPMNIDDVVEELGGEDKFFGFAKPECYVNGHWVGLPWRGDTRISCYNSDMFAEAGIESFPTTLDELLTAAQKLTTYDAKGNVDRAGFLFRQSGPALAQTFRALLAGMGGSVMNEDYTEFTIDTPEVRETLQFMQDCLYKYKVMPTTILDPTFTADDAYAAGKAAIVFGAVPDYLETLKNNAPQIADVTVGAVSPSKTGEGASSIAFAAPVVIFNATEHEGAAKEWLKYLFQTENQLTLSEGCGTVSVWDDVLKQDRFSSQWYQTVLQQNSRAVPGDMPVTVWSQVDASPNGPLNTMVMDVMAGNDIDTAIATCVAAINEIIASAE